MRVSEKPWDAIEIDRGRTPWLIAVIAFLPMLLAYAVHFGLPPDGARGTGFLQSDQPMYMAAAIRHFEHGFFPAYGLPYSPDYDTPRVNVQLILLLLGSLVHLTGWDPGYVFAVFGIVAGVVMLRMAIALLTSFSGPMRGVAGMVTCFLFLWGGGVLALSGLVWGLSKGLPFSYWSLREEVFRFDPFDGYWFLNLGRNVFYPLEAFFHCLFFGAILCMRHKKYLGGFILLIGAMLNHPFTALELSLVMGGIVALEFILRVDPPPLWIVVAVGVSVPFFLLHSLYLVGLLSTEQTVVVAQNALDWSIDWKSMAAGYLPVVAIVILRFLRAPSLTGFLG